MFHARQRALSFRRWILRRIVPETVWPEHVWVDGVRIAVRGTPYSYGVKRTLSSSDCYEKPERELVSEFLEPGMTVLEFGGSIGVLTAVMASRVSRNGRVISFEADPKLVEHARSWLESDGHVTVVNGFAFPVWGLPPHFQVTQFDSDRGSLGGKVHFSLQESPPTAGRRGWDGTRVWDLGRIQSEFNVEPDALVVDIEGSEAIMALTSLGLPKSIQHLMIELHPLDCSRYGVRELEVGVAIMRDGFQLVRRKGGSYWFKRDSNG